MRLIDLTCGLTEKGLHGEAHRRPTQLETPDALFELAQMGTRIESPSYLLQGGKRLDQFGPESFFQSAVLLDLTHKVATQFIDDEDLEAAEEVAGLAVREGEGVIIRTGWDRNFRKGDYPSSHLGLSENGAEYLASRHVSMVCTDTPNLDYPNNESLTAHSVLFERGMLVVEDLCNLVSIDQDRFQLIVLPLKVGVSCSPARAVADVEGMK